MPSIEKIHAREVLDSRGRPTVEVEVFAEKGIFGRAIVPSGASTGTAEALELRDENSSRYDSLGVLQAVEHVNSRIAPALRGTCVSEQKDIDDKLLKLDGTKQKENLGANALLGVSLAVAHAGAESLEIPLYQHIYQYFANLTNAQCGDLVSNPKFRMPLPMTNMISGGLHAGGNLDFQDFLVMPNGAPDYKTGLEWIVRVYRRLGGLLRDSGYEGRLVGDEGGYGPRLESNRQAAEFIVQAILAADLLPGTQMTIALDVAATHFYDGRGYRLAAEGNKRLTSSQLIDKLEALVEEFPITSIEDGLAEDDWDGWSKMTARLGEKVRLVGDDLFTTNVIRIRRGIRSKSANSVLIKVNQIGTLTETLEAMHVSREAGFECVVSARSGETEDTTIADLAVGTSAEHIKIGSIVRSERLAKYNQLLRIEEKLLGY